MRIFTGISTFKPAYIMVIILFWVLYPNSVWPDTIKKNIKKDEQRPIIIKSKTLEINNQVKIVTFTGDVNVQKDDFVADCQQLDVYYNEHSSQSGASASDSGIEKIVATGLVKITQARGGVATAGEVIYYQRDEKMVLTENPVVRQGDNLIEGDRIIIFIKENRSIVESFRDKKVKAVIFPARKNR